MDKMTEALQKIRLAQGTLCKQAVLKMALEVPGFEDFVVWTLNPYKTFGISHLPFWHEGLREFRLSDWITLEYYLKSMANRTLTGYMARVTINNFASEFDAAGQDLIRTVIQRDLRAGIGAKTVNKVKKIIPSFEVQLAYPSQGIEIVFPCRVDPKIDGVRLIVLKEDGDVSLLSRSGKPLNIPWLYKYLTSWHEDNFMLDGEFHHPEGFQHLMSLIQSDIPSPSILSGTYAVFHHMSVEEFQNGNQFESDHSLDDFGAESRIYHIEYTIVHNAEELDAVYNKSLLQGYEGVMIKKLKGLYDFKRSRNWLKLKPVQTLDVLCVDIFEGEGKYKDMMGGVTIVIPGTQLLCNVGSGFTDDERDNFWRCPHAIKDKIIEVGYQEMTDDGLLRFPRFYRIREDKSE